MEEELQPIKEAVSEEVAKVESEVSIFDEKVEQWFSQHFHGVNGMSTELYNHFYKAKESLKTLLKG